MAQWNIDASHSNIEFSAKHLMVTTVRGRFEDYSVELNFDPQTPGASTVNAAIQVASITTGNTDRDNHLKSPDFLNAEANPTITFTSTAVEVTGENTGRISGNLTINGVTKPVVLETEYAGLAKDPWGNTRVAFSASTKINREDFGLTWNVALETGGVLVGKDIKIEIELQAIQVAETQPA